jgi:hypothetical protein
MSRVSITQKPPRKATSSIGKVTLSYLTTAQISTLPRPSPSLLRPEELNQSYFPKGPPVLFLTPKHTPIISCLCQHYRPSQLTVRLHQQNPYLKLQSHQQPIFPSITTTTMISALQVAVSLIGKEELSYNAKYVGTHSIRLAHGSTPGVLPLPLSSPSMLLGASCLLLDAGSSNPSSYQHLRTNSTI